MKMAVEVSRLVGKKSTATNFGSLSNIADQTSNFTSSSSSSSSSPKCPYTSQKLSTEAAATGPSSTSIDHASAKSFGKLPGDWKSKFPIIGALPIFLPYINKPENGGGMRTEDFMRDYYEKYGKEYGVCQFGATPQPAALVFDEGFLEVYKNEGKYPSGILTGMWPIEHFNRLTNINLKNPFLAKGGKTEGGETWRQGRMSLNPHIFNLQTAKTYLPAINEAATTAANCFEDYATTGRLDVFCERAAFDMFGAAGLGLQVGSVQEDEDGVRLMEAINGGFSKGAHVAQACPWSRIDMFKFGEWKAYESKWKGGREAGKELVRKALDDGEGGGTGIVHGFFNDPDLKISKEEAIEMFLVLTFAAADTTSSLVNNVLTNLARNPDVQDKVRTEFQAALNGDDYDAKVKLPYFEQVLKETQRLTPSLGFTNVKTDIPRDLVINGFHIPAGYTVIFSHMGIANDEELAGPNPQVFDPDRFSDTAVAARKGTRAEFLDHPMACKPFGFGARMCVGSRIAKLEFTSLICRLIQDYSISMDDEANAGKDPIRLSHTTTIEYPAPTLLVDRL